MAISARNTRQDSLFAVRQRHPYFSVLTKISAGTFASLSVGFLSVVLIIGLPEKAQSPKEYVNGVCQKIKSSVDTDLPCPDEFGDGSERPSNRKALWSVIRTLCLPASYLGLSFPCLRIDRAEGYAVIRSPSRASLDFIVTPTTFVEGVESLYHSKTTAPNLWKAGWMSRDLLEDAAHRDLAWDEIILAVNSKATRSQDHLHIHLGCVERKLRSYLAAEVMLPGSDWRIMGSETITPGFFVKFLKEDALNSDFFDKVIKEIPGGMKFAETQTIALAGVSRRSYRGFALMVTLAPMAAERLLAPSC